MFRTALNELYNFLGVDGTTFLSCAFFSWAVIATLILLLICAAWKEDLKNFDEKMKRFFPKSEPKPEKILDERLVPEKIQICWQGTTEKTQVSWQASAKTIVKFDVCQQCGFKYGWDGKSCKHCGNTIC